MAEQMAAVKRCNLAIYSILHFTMCLLLLFLAELINASDRHLNFLFMDIRFIQTSVTMNIFLFLTIADNKIDGQNNESEVEVNNVGYPLQNTVQISKLICHYNKLSVCL